MRRVPVLPTLVVAVAVATMVALGLWQLLIRLPEKEAFLAQLAGNPAKPVVALPHMADESLLFRRAAGRCVSPRMLPLTGAGAAGFRALAECEGGTLVQLGTTRDPMARVAWAGGPVRGYLTYAPDTRSALAGLVSPGHKRLMLVADPPAAGLGPNTPPDPDTVPNNHLAYAGQWFFFAAIASVIYILALRRRSTPMVRP